MPTASKWIVFLIGTILFGSFIFSYPMFTTGLMNGHLTLSLRLDLPWAYLGLDLFILALVIAAIRIGVTYSEKPE